MSLTSGFYNSAPGTTDRKYSAEDFSNLFSGIITDGVVAYGGYVISDDGEVLPKDALESSFKVEMEQDSNTVVNILPGKIWVQGKWVINDSVLTYDIGTRSDIIVTAGNACILAICLHLNTANSDGSDDTNAECRSASIRFIQGPIKSSAQIANFANADNYPNISPGDGYTDYVLAYAIVRGSTIRASEIKDNRGITDTKGNPNLPWCTSFINNVTIDVAATNEAYQVQFEDLYIQTKARYENFASDLEDLLEDVDPGDIEELSERIGVYVNRVEEVDDEINNPSTGLKALIQNLREDVLQSLYPVGSLYINATDNRNPSLIIGYGVWEQVTDCYIAARGSSVITGETGGSATHTHGLSNVAAYVHVTSGRMYWRSGRKTLTMTTDDLQWEPAGGGSKTGRTATGSYSNAGFAIDGNADQASNLPPYAGFYIWKRVS